MCDIDCSRYAASELAWCLPFDGSLDPVELVLYFAAAKGGGVSGGGIAGIVVGAVVGLLAIAAALFFFLHKKSIKDVRCSATPSLHPARLNSCKPQYLCFFHQEWQAWRYASPR